MYSTFTTDLYWGRIRTAGVLLLAAVLAYEPLVWLLGTWTAPGYQGLSFVPCLAVLVLVSWSFTSDRLGRGSSSKVGIATLAATAILRLASQILDINVLGALLLSVDVYGLALLLGLQQRTRALSPLWLAILFSFCLPIEPMVQRIFGYGLQQVSADLACQMLGLWYADLHCVATRISIKGTDVFVDLPCSGAKLLSTAGFLFSTLAAFKRPTAKQGIILIVLLLLLVWIVNAWRIMLLGVGIAEAQWLGFSVMSPLIHEFIGLVCVGLVMCLMYGLTARIAHAQKPLDSAPGVIDIPSQSRGLRLQTLVVFALLPFALSIGAIKPQPLDVTRSLPTLPTPTVVADLFAEEHRLTAQERTYFAVYGGRARRLSYGPYGLLLVSTASPLRHLHDPVICMTANGFDVELVGTDHSRRSTVYRATHMDKGEFFLLVSYVSARGEVATSVAEVVWHWFRQPSRWTMVQRIIPVHELPHSTDWDTGMRRAFNV